MRVQENYQKNKTNCLQNWKIASQFTICNNISFQIDWKHFLHQNFDFTLGSINSEGRPNSGIDYYTNIQKVCEPLSKYNKPYIVSLSGLSLDDNLEMLKRVLEK